MTLQQIIETSDEQMQIQKYNQASAMVQRSQYSPPAGTHWAVCGLLLNAAVTPADEAALVASIEALSEVTTVANPRIWGQCPSSVLMADHEMVLYTESNLSYIDGPVGEQHAASERRIKTIKPPVDQKWMVVNLVLAAKCETAGEIAALEAALTGVTGIASGHRLIGGTIPTDASAINIALTTRMRIDPIEA